MRAFIETLQSWLANDEQIALATVVGLKGSSLRPVGSHMAVTASGKMTGSVSGGCVAGAVVQKAQEVLACGEAARLRYEPTDDEGWQLGLSCGGSVEIYVEPFTNLHQRWSQALKQGETVALATALDEAKHALIWPDGDWEGDKALVAALPDLFAQPTNSTHQTTLGEIFCQTFSPPPTLNIIGAVHIATRLAELAQTLDFRTRVIDARQAFATPERFPHANELIQAWPQEALSPQHLRPQDAVIVLSHDAKFDLPTLEIALDSDVGYIGLLGSTSTQEKRKQALREKGFSPSTLARIHGPIGLDLGAKTPGEIAVSILAEIIAVQHGKKK